MSSFLVFRPRVRKTLLCLFLAVAGVCLSLSAPVHAVEKDTAQQSADTASQAIVFIGFTGVRWEDINEKDTPNLFAFTQKAQGANLVVKTFAETTCPTRGWFTMGSGARMEGTCAPIEITDGRVAQWDSYIAGNAKNPYKPRVGRLGETLEKSVGSEEILVLGSGAGLALADGAGKISGRYIDTVRVGDTAGRNASRVGVVEGLSHIDDSTRLVVLDVGQVRYGSSASVESSREGIQSFKAAFMARNEPLPDEAKVALSDIDRNFGQAIEHVHATMPHARILVASLADSQTSLGELSFFAAHGLSDDGSSAFVYSNGTRHDGLIQITDLTASLISWLDPGSSQSKYVSGASIFASKATDSLAETLAGNQHRAYLSRGFVGPFYVTFLTLTVILAYAAWRVLRRNVKDESCRSDAHPYLALAALFTALLPVASVLVNIVPWWRLSHPLLAYVAVLGGIALLIAGIASIPAVRGRPSISLAIVGLVTAGVIAVDVVTSSFSSYSLQFPSVLGGLPQVAGRFYGVFNATFAIFAAGLLIGLAVVVSFMLQHGQYLQARVLIVVCAIFAVTVDGLAILGADFGGPPALTLGMVLLFLMVSKKRITIPRVLLLVIAALGVSLFFSILDYVSSTTHRSHLGRFIQSVRDGNLLSVLSRKISSAVLGLPTPIALVLMLICFFVLVWLWHMWTKRGFSWQKILRRISLLLGLSAAEQSSNGKGVEESANEGVIELSIIRYSVPTVLVTLISAAFINDSSITIPVVGGAVALMLYSALVFRHAEKV